VSFVCLLQVHLFLPENGSLKGKRKQLNSIKALLQRRFGAAVAETEHHDLWQRSTLTVALVAREAGSLAANADALERFVESRFPDGAHFERSLLAAEELAASGQTSPDSQWA
jgi:uncharacterized protein YlxP (DUF503 family)